MCNNGTHEQHVQLDTFIRTPTPESADRFLAQIDNGCEECAFALFGCSDPTRVLVDLTAKAAFKGVDLCPDLSELVTFALGEMPLSKAIRVAAHVANCPTCSAEVFEKGLAQRANEVNRRRAENATRKARQALDQIYSAPEQLLRLLEPSGHVKYQLRRHGSEPSCFKLKGDALNWLSNQACTLQLTNVVSGEVIGEITIATPTKEQARTFATTWPGAFPTQLQQRLRSPDQALQQLAAAAGSHASWMGLCVEDPKGNRWSLEPERKEIAMWIRIEAPDE